MDILITFGFSTIKADNIIEYTACDNSDLFNNHSDRA